MDDEWQDGRIFGGAMPCFGCDPGHPHGLRLRFRRVGDEMETRFVPGPDHQGPPGILHGGLAATLADETAAWALVGLERTFGFTTAFEARLKGPIRIGLEVEGRSRIVEREGRNATVAVRLVQGGKDCFTGTFRFAILDRADAERFLGGTLPPAFERFLA